MLAVASVLLVSLFVGMFLPPVTLKPKQFKAGHC